MTTGIEQSNRLENIDLIRGIALLGLPFMNIINFAMPMSAYWNPTSYGNDDFLNHPLYIFFHLFADQKFMGLFSLLFGAGIILFAEKLQASGRKAGLIHYSRQFWLLVIGCLHAFFLWEGDILIIYAVIGMLLYPLKNLKAKWLMVMSLLMLLLAAYMSSMMINNANINDDNWQELTILYSPSLDQIEELKSSYLGSYSDVLSQIRGENMNGDGSVIFKFMFGVIIKVVAMMLLGMSLFKAGILTNNFSKQLYKGLIICCGSVGLLITTWGLYWNYSNQWSMEAFFSQGYWPNIIGAAATTIAYAALIILWFNSSSLNWLKQKIQAVGRMALTNYLTQSIICAFIFYGYGLGWYGSFSRLELLPIIIGIGIFQVIFSSFWLTYFKQGPFEWIWRILSYLKWQNPITR
jgi:uncharacterized protein